MKLIKIAILLCSLTCAGQYNFFGWQEHTYTPADFPDGTTRIDIYEINFNKKGKAKDSTIVRTVLLDRATNTVSYKKPLMRFKSRDIEYNTFKYQYDSRNRVVYSEESRSERQDGGKWLWAFRRESFGYNNLGKVTNHTIFKQDSWYYLKGKDTLWDYINRDKSRYTSEYRDSLLKAAYTEEDFSGLYHFENGELKDSMIYSYPRYRNDVYFYNERGNLIAGEGFTRDNNLMNKTRYEYDNDGRIVKEYIDTGYYNKHDKAPEWDLRYSYEYDKGNKTQTFYFNNGTRHIQGFDSHDNLTRYTTYENDMLKNDERYQYFYEKGKVVKVTRTSDGDPAGTIQYMYDNKGFLKEEKFTTDAIENRIHYYYQ